MTEDMDGRQARMQDGLADPAVSEEIFKESGKGRGRWYHWLKWGDWLLYGLFGGLAVVLLLLMPGLQAGTQTSAVVLLDGKVMLEVSAEQLNGSGEVPLTANGFHYLLVYADGRIRFSEADCPDRVCVRTGWISKPGQIAACVPGHLILKITGDLDQQETNPDGVDVIVR